MPLDLTEQQRRHLSTRLMVQAPRDMTPVQLARMRAELDRKIGGIAAGDLVRLEALHLLAEQGNVVAQDLYDMSLEGLLGVRFVR